MWNLNITNPAKSSKCQLWRSMSIVLVRVLAGFIPWLLKKLKTSTHTHTHKHSNTGTSKTNTARLSVLLGILLMKGTQFVFGQPIRNRYCQNISNMKKLSRTRATQRYCWGSNGQSLLQICHSTGWLIDHSTIESQRKKLLNGLKPSTPISDHQWPSTAQATHKLKQSQPKKAPAPSVMSISRRSVSWDKASATSSCRNLKIR